MRSEEVRALRPLRSAVVAIVLTAAVATVLGATTFLTGPDETLPDLGALPPTGSEVLFQVGVVVAGFLVAWVLVMASGLVRRDRR